MARPYLVLKHIKDNFIEKFEEEDITKWTKDAISKIEQVHATNIIEDDNPVEIRDRWRRKDKLHSSSDVAIKYRGKSSFLIADNKKFGVMMKSLGLPDAIPSFAVEVRKNKDTSSGSTSRFKFANDVGEGSVPTDGTSASPAQHAKADALKSYKPYNRIHYVLQNTEAPNAITSVCVNNSFGGVMW
ncbi:MAG: hypothetical protein EZS28_007435 [Streblomastix strix]|uniref:Uncharacterized protein n=1 Tax=Streblomastix strix TaxID=222440 RepID=A0A5J4WSG5_9EUKA|nr:MAG: hypothetical protein EZS28_007435 [Streblomastix strix]